MNDCIFCKIINDELPSKTVYEDNDIKIIMNINPSTNGHLLVLTKKHLETFMEVDNSTITHALDIVREKIYPLLKEKLNAEGLTLAQNNDLGQEVKHFHIHLTPRYPNDLADIEYDKSNLEDLDIVFDKLKN